MNFDRFVVALGGGDEIGASSYLLRIGNHKVLIDAGFRLQSSRNYPDYSYISEVGMLGLYELSCVCLTHAHMDHSGSLPAIYQKTRNYKHEVPIFATSPTVDIVEILMRDTLKIKTRQGAYQGDLDIQEYEKEVTDNTIQSIQRIPFNQPVDVSQNLRITYYPAGHILGAAMVLVEIDNYRALFSGDFGGPGQMTVSGYELPDGLGQIDLFVCESTYAYSSKQAAGITNQQQRLVEQVVKCIKRGGKVLIPAFAVGRAQEILSLLRRSMDEDGIDSFPVWSDGMVNQVCDVYNHNRGYLNPSLKHHNGDHLFFSGNLDIGPSPLRVRSPRFREELDDLPPSCIVASSGMMIDGSCSSYYAEALLESPKNMILFTGYLDEESPGKRLLSARDARYSNFKLNQKHLRIEAEIEPYHLSAHAGLNHIKELVDKIKPKNVAFVHGYPDNAYTGNIYDLYYHWGRQGIQPLIARNNNPVFF